MQENTTLNALIMRRARDLISAYGWPEHIHIDHHDPVNRPGWVNLCARLDANDLIALIPTLHKGAVCTELQQVMKKISGTTAQIILSSN